MEQKRIKVRLTENSPYSDYGYYKKGDIGYIDGYVNDNAVIILENGKFVKADLRWIELVEQKHIDKIGPNLYSGDIEVLKEVISAYENGTFPFLKEDRIRIAERLKAIRPTKAFKPNDEQMKALKEAVDEHFDIDGGALWHLYEDLKKL